MSTNKSSISKRAKRQIIMLAAIFLAGMAVNILGMPSETEGVATTVSAVLTGLHIFIGIGLVTGGIITLRTAFKNAHELVSLAWVGMVSVLAAFISGAIMMVTDNDWWSFAMAASFLAAILAYGAIMVRAQKA